MQRHVTHLPVFGEMNPSICKIAALNVLAFLDNEDLYNSMLVRICVTYGLMLTFWFARALTNDDNTVRSVAYGRVLPSMMLCGRKGEREWLIFFQWHLAHHLLTKRRNH